MLTLYSHEIFIYENISMVMGGHHVATNISMSVETGRPEGSAPLWKILLLESPFSCIGEGAGDEVIGHPNQTPGN